MHPHHEELTKRYEGGGKELSDDEMDELSEWENGRTPAKYRPQPGPKFREGILGMPLEHRIPGFRSAK